MPYTIMGDREFNFLTPSSTDWDKWAIGAMLLEILVGSHLLTWCTNWRRFHDLWQAVREEFDYETMRVIDHLCFSSPGNPVGWYLESYLPKHPSVIAESMRKVEDAIAEHKELQEMDGAATAYQMENAQLVWCRHKYKNEWVKECVIKFEGK
jgi:hypothetical protein